MTPTPSKKIIPVDYVIPRVTPFFSVYFIKVFVDTKKRKNTDIL